MFYQLKHRLKNSLYANSLTIFFSMKTKDNCTKISGLSQKVILIFFYNMKIKDILI